jgi:protocatechuate 3,4-dioxygenase alpha subunit
VFARGLLIHAVTRIYFEDETNDADPVLSRLDPEGRTSLLARREEGGPHAHYRFDVILQGPNETVFFDV